MMKTVWPQRRHGELAPVSENVWRVVGTAPRMLIKRQMVVARDRSGRLLVHSAIALNEQHMSRLEALGALTWLVVPNGYHRLDAAAYKARFPAMLVVAPSGAVPRVREVVDVDLSYEQFPEHHMFRFHTAPWPDPKEGVLEIRDARRAVLVFNDLVFNPAGSGSAEWLYRLVRQGPQVPWLAKRMFARDSAGLRDWLLKLADTEGLSVVIPGHGDPIASDASATLRQIAAAS